MAWEMSSADKSKNLGEYLEKVYVCSIPTLPWASKQSHLGDRALW